MQGVMEGQLSIFDFLSSGPEVQYPDFTGMDEAEVIQAISRHTGLSFIYEARFKAWQHKVKKPKGTMEISVRRYSTLDARNGRPFISVGMMYKNGGWGSPCDSLGEAVKRIEDEQAKWRCWKE